MKLFMQGMRRSGTTIVFDCLSQDERLDLYYEPFSAINRGRLGGGSGMQQVDLMQKMDAFRRSFIENNRLNIDPDVLNYGAPRNPQLEILGDLPAVHRQYISEMLAQSQHTVIKFVRMYSKVPVLNALSEEGSFALLVRHPQEVVASYMYGRDQHRLNRISNRRKFFARRSSTNPWNSDRILEFLAEEEGRPELLKMPDWMRYLALWKYTFERPFHEGRAAFGDRFMLIRYEDMTVQTVETLTRLYRHVGLEPSRLACEWAESNLRPSIKECYADDERWLAAYDELDLHAALADAGYASARPVLGQVKRPRATWYRRLLP